MQASAGLARRNYGLCISGHRVAADKSAAGSAHNWTQIKLQAREGAQTQPFQPPKEMQISSEETRKREERISHLPIYPTSLTALSYSMKNCQGTSI